LRCEKKTLAADWSLHAGESHYFTLQYSNSYSNKIPKPVQALSALEETARFWKRWTKRNRYRGPYRDQVERSLITLKALTYAPSGGFVAAPTASLPEKIGGIRNWDYRFCWLRDTTFSLQGLLECGFEEEARAWLGWLNRSFAEAADTSVERLQCYEGINEEKAIGKFDESLQRLCVELTAKSNSVDWEVSANRVAWPAVLQRGAIAKCFATRKAVRVADR
jgi:hypothetical protein